MWRGGFYFCSKKRMERSVRDQIPPSFYSPSSFSSISEYLPPIRPSLHTALQHFFSSSLPHGLFLALARSNNILLCAILVRGVWQESVLGHVAIEDVTGWETTSCIEFRHRWLSCKIMFSFSSILPGVAGSTWNKGKIHLCKKSSWTCLLYLSHFLLCLSFIYIGHQQFTISQEPC